MAGELRGIDWEMTNAVNEFDDFVSLLNKGDRPAAFDLLRKINLSIVGQYFREKYAADSKEMAIYNCASVIRDSLLIEETYKQQKH